MNKDYKENELLIIVRVLDHSLYFNNNKKKLISKELVGFSVLIFVRFSLLQKVQDVKHKWEIM